MQRLQYNTHAHTEGERERAIERRVRGSERERMVKEQKGHKSLTFLNIYTKTVLENKTQYGDNLQPLCFFLFVCLLFSWSMCQITLQFFEQHSLSV